MYGNMGDGVVGLFRLMMVVIAVSVPLGLWKLVEIVLYLNAHFHVRFTP